MSMGLPAVTTFADCADWTKTVTPYIPQLYDLPQQIYLNINNLQALKVLYVSTNPFVSGFAFSLFLMPIFLITSEVNRNWSQVDRFWPILPTFYNIHYAIYAHAVGVPTKRMDTLAVVTMIWGTRLTYNYWRRGGYNIGAEDYRWALVKDYIGTPLFFVLNVVFISSLQSTLLFIITSPAYVMLVAAKGLGDTQAMADVIFSRTMGLLVFVLYVADTQQWNFYEARTEYRNKARAPAGYHPEDLERGFNVTGLFAWSRHPNFAAEQTFWVTLYAWCAYITKGYLNWSIVGALCYLLLFQSSTWLTELISLRKYPEYAEYRNRVGRFLPKLPGGPPGDFSDKRKTE